MKYLFTNIFFWFVLLFWIIGLILVLNTNALELHKILNGFNHFFLDIMVPIATHIGDGLFAVLVVVIFYFISKKKSLIILITFLVSSGIAQFMKHIIFPEAMRPMHYFQNDDCFHLVPGVVLHTQNSFPSGHATTCFAIFTTFALFWRLNHKLEALFATCAILFALTRVYLSQHFFEDILAGSFIGTVTAFLVWNYLPKIRFVEKLE
jgi:membrane-associated phospholipid phosphatase